MRSDASYGPNHLAVGPEMFGGVIRAWGLACAIVNHQWNLGGGDGGPGSNDQDFSTTTAQYFYAISPGEGWQAAAAPVVTYDWKARDSDEARTVPVGIGVARTTKLGGMPWKFQFQIEKYVEQPDAFGPDWLFKLTITPVIHSTLFVKK